MKSRTSKLIVFVVMVAILLSSCTLKVLTPAYVNANNGQQVYTSKSYQFGPALPVITVINPYRQMSRR